MLSKSFASDIATLTANSATETAIKRLQSIRWEWCGSGGDHTALRAHWTAFTCGTKAICNAHALGDGFRQRCAAVLMLSKNQHQAGYADAIGPMLRDRYQWRGVEYVALALSSYLEWEILDEDKRAAISSFPGAINPYLPLVQFFEAGGAFTTEHGMIDKILPDGVLDAGPRTA